MDRVLSRDFYARPTVEVARELIGKLLVHRTGRGVASGKIVETEAYLGQKDAGSHAFRGPTPRASIMFGPPGRAYVYFIYGNHYCFNVVCHDGEAGAVLVRAVEPIGGLRGMFLRRGVSEMVHLTNGPGKLTRAFGISGRHNGADLTFGPILIREGEPAHGKITASPRVGLSRGTSRLYRFCLKANPFVSKPFPW